MPDTDILSDANAQQRAAIAPQAIPLAKELVSDLDGMRVAKPAYKWQILNLRPQFVAALYAFGDEATVSTLTAQAKLSGREGLDAKCVLLRARWYKAGQDGAKLEPVLNDVEALATSHPTDTFLTLLISDIRSSAKDPDVQQRMVDLLTDTMDNMVADNSLAAMKSDNKLRSFQGKPLVLAGKQPDGSDFTTADWKGKVILVDFWAVWCAPCKEELSRVKAVYEQYHEKGLEVLGVDNDYKAASVMAYASAAQLPWPQLFDIAAGVKSAWNPLTRGFGIDGIPVMFLIDKKGMLRTVSARDNFEKLIPQLLAE